MVCEFLKSWVLNKLRLHKKTLSPRYTLSCVFTWLVETLAKRRNNDRWAPMNYMWPGHPLLPIIGYMKALYCYLVKANIESSPMTLSSMFIYLLQQRHTVKKIFRIKQLVKKKCSTWIRNCPGLQMVLAGSCVYFSSTRGQYNATPQFRRGLFFTQFRSFSSL